LDFGNHITQCVHAKCFYSEYETDFLCHLDKKELYENDLKGSNVVSIAFDFRFYPILSLLYLLLFSFRYDKVVFLTGLEYTHGLNRGVCQILWLLLLLVWGRKIILYIKNSLFYLDSMFFSLSLFFISSVCFESKYLMARFVDSFNLFDIAGKCKATYVYYSDVEPRQLIKNSNKIVRVGVVGSLDESRRDYSVLERQFNNIEFVLVGKSTPDIHLLSDKLLGKVVVVQNSYSTEELFKLISTCDILLCLNRLSRKYGSFKGTGAFADAIASNRPIIAPLMIDEIKEFQDFSIYFNSNDHLLEVLKHLNDNGVSSLISDSSFSKFTLDSVRYRK
ncbi:hypothetical protein, partial [Shewanella sp. 10N.286.52.B9]|uniref:hypothetical protein n=1 Tax=Shewanella sp. 10N.286.52.B9 TaxID=1880837 RepID=UPI0012FFE144